MALGPGLHQSSCPMHRRGPIRPDPAFTRIRDLGPWRKARATRFTFEKHHLPTRYLPFLKQIVNDSVKQDDTVHPRNRNELTQSTNSKRIKICFHEGYLLLRDYWNSLFPPTSPLTPQLFCNAQIIFHAHYDLNCMVFSSESKSSFISTYMHINTTI